MDRTRVPVVRLRKGREAIPHKLTYVGLWASLALMMVAFPFVQGPYDSSAFTILFALLLGAAVMTVQGWKWFKLVALILLTISVAAQAAFSLTDEGWLELISYIFAAMTLAWVTTLLFLTLFKTKEVTSTTIWEAVSVYILIGLTWASVYSIVDVISPGSFEDSSLPNTEMSFHTFIYYSFVTLATLGYGDIVPMTQEARGIAILEVLTGVLYMAILISRLVGTWKPGKNGENES